MQVKFRSGAFLGLPYLDLKFVHYDPDSGSVDVDFAGILVTVKGRGLGERVAEAIMQRRVVWLKEADSEMQDNPTNELFIKEILVTPPGVEQAAAA